MRKNGKYQPQHTHHTVGGEAVLGFEWGLWGAEIGGLAFILRPLGAVLLALWFGGRLIATVSERVVGVALRGGVAWRRM
jgi:hypothetical protein